MNENPANSQNPQQPPQQSKKKVRETYTLKPEHFQKQNGIQSLYKAIQKIDLTKGQDNVEASMKKIVVALKTWHFEMLPRYSFDYFLQRCKVLGNNKFTQAYMSKVRKVHKKQDTWGTQQVKETDPLNNVELDHLNPNNENHLRQMMGQQETLDQKIERAMKLVSQFQENHQPRSQIKKMQIQKPQNQHRQIEVASDESDDECEDLFRQMDALQKQKKQLFSQYKTENNAQRIQQKVVQKDKVKQDFKQQSEQPYVPEGFDEIDYAQQSSYNNEG